MDYHQIRLSGPEIALARESLEHELDLIQVSEEIELRDGKEISEVEKMTRGERVRDIKALIVKLGGRVE